MANKNRLVWTNDVMAFLCKRCNEMYSDEPCEPSDCLMLEELDKCNSVDAVPVVRCKDCKFLHDRGYCTLVAGMTRIEPDDYCSRGERRTYG